MDWRYNSIWFEQIDSEKKLNYDFQQKSILPLNIKEIEYFVTWHSKHKGVAFDLFPPSDKLLYLQMNWANIKDFFGIEKFTHLKRLEVHYCTKLENDKGISVLKNTIEHLNISQSKKLQSVAEICELKNLKVLCLNSCGDLESLNFLKEFPKLLNFRFVNTNVLDGDLTPILEHPTLRSCNFLNKRNYNYTSEKINLTLQEKSNEEYIDWIYKDKWKDFKYKAYGH